MEQKEKFPLLLFSIYVAYYAGQAVQSAYQSLFLTQSGFSPSQIGTMTAITTVVILLIQTLFGALSDRAKVKNRVILVLYIGAFLSALLLFFVPSSFIPVLIVLAVFSGFFSPIVPLTDDLSTTLVVRNKKFDYGTVRMGGTIGYAVMMLISGYLLNDNYKPIFIIIATSLFIGFLLFLRLPQVEGKPKKREKTETKEKNFLRIVLENKRFLVLIGFSLLISVGETLYGSYYSIYYLTIGGNSKLLGIMQFACALSEVPCLFVIGRIVRKIGTGKTLALSAAVACVRWFLLYLIADPISGIFVGLLHGITFSSSNYCIVNYISKHMDASARASGQVFRNTASMIFSRAIFGYIGGILYDTCGPRSLMLLSAVVVGFAAVFMFVWSRKREEALRI